MIFVAFILVLFVNTALEECDRVHECRMVLERLNMNGIVVFYFHKTNYCTCIFYFFLFCFLDLNLGQNQFEKVNLSRKLSLRRSSAFAGRETSNIKCVVERANQMGLPMADKNAIEKLSQLHYKHINESFENDATRYWAIALKLQKTGDYNIQMKNYIIWPGTLRLMERFGGLLPWDYVRLIKQRHF